MDPLPPEIALQILQYLPIRSIHAVQLVSRSYSDLINSNESQVYQSAALLHRFVPDDIPLAGLDSHSLLARCKKTFLRYSTDDILDWKAFVRKCFEVESRWRGERHLSHSGEPVKRMPACGLHVHRFKIDEDEMTVLSTSQRGGLVVSSIDTEEVLWSLPESYVRAYAHLEFGKGFAIFERIGGYTEVWRRSADALEPSTYLPSNPDPSQIAASPGALPRSVTTGTAAAPSSSDLPLGITPTSIPMALPLPRRGAYLPFALLKNPAHTSAYRFVYPHLVSASPFTAKAYIWHVPTATLIETISILPPSTGPRSPEDAGWVSYVDISDQHIFVCWSTGLQAYRWKATSEDKKIGGLELCIPPPNPNPQMRPSIHRFRIEDAGSGVPTRDPLADYRYWTAVHVSPDGRDLVGVCDDRVVFISDFLNVAKKMSQARGSRRKRGPVIPGIFSMDMTIGCEYLSFDGNRAVVETAAGAFIFNLRDRRDLLPQGFPTRPTIAHLYFPQLGLPDFMDRVSCLQMTETAVWSAKECSPEQEGGERDILNIVTCINFADVTEPESAWEDDVPSGW